MTAVQYVVWALKKMDEEEERASSCLSTETGMLAREATAAECGGRVAEVIVPKGELSCERERQSKTVADLEQLWPRQWTLRTWWRSERRSRLQ